ncbi:hypothetical protein [Piscinibacter gummiphilus]|uniref:Pre-toxin TG domain-containing protein n=1 Tax=Piscinibacter gummiphilus TaxID=946333 RepID=A0ABZ0CPY4_9BURK|nr:hypothetical protein [Piscinibacter gummiphilus]WOB07042.1 hypothetical protein RXV79_19225 [Piscinibacter gummiphilus]
MSFSFEEIVKGINRWKHSAKSAAMDAKQKANWVWEALQGDFNPNRSAGQVGFDTVVCLIPGVDTIMDIRDLIANIIAIVAAPTNGMAWFNLVLTLIGFVPELGSVVKGVVKIVFVKLRPLLKSADDLTHASKMVKHMDEAIDAAMPSIVQYLNHPKVQKFLTTTGVPDVIKWTAKSIRELVSKIDPATLKAAFNEKAESLKSILQYLRPLLPASAGPKIKNVFDGIVTVQKNFEGAVNKFMGPLHAMMLHLAKRLDEMHWVAQSQQLNKGWIAPLSEQGARRLMAKHRPAWVKTAPPAEFKQLDPEKFRRKLDYVTGVKAGAPQLDDTAIRSFTAGAKARPLKDGETLYRVLDPTSGSLSTCWIPESVWKQINADPAKAREMWRGQLAVKPEWNQNGTFVKYTYNKARDGDITVWEGRTSMQWLGPTGDHSAGFLEGGLPQIVFDPKKQIRNAQPDNFVSAQFPDMVEGTVIRKADGAAQPSGVRTKINDPRVEGPFETGWGFKDFADQHDLIGLPNPLKV